MKHSAIPSPITNIPNPKALPKRATGSKLPLKRWLTEFIHSKQQQNITALTIHQLNQSRSPKTNKEFVAAIKQFFKWFEAVEKIPNNPAKRTTATFRTQQHASEERLHWRFDELVLLFNHNEFKQSTQSLQWCSRLQLYMGLRPSEACQLRVSDVWVSTTIPSIAITDKALHQHVKNKHAIRKVPIHPELIKLGFLDFV
ncbi:hypothetical protein VCR17J2_340090 [Vibrio coralliirubri]|nr:hypothetical protein VCR17J2_340090 [Vibrio coralliirubri]